MPDDLLSTLAAPPEPARPAPVAQLTAQVPAPQPAAEAAPQDDGRTVTVEVPSTLHRYPDSLHARWDGQHLVVIVQGSAGGAMVSRGQGGICLTPAAAARLARLAAAGPGEAP